MRLPQVLREGTKKTIFVNFTDLCKTMHRQPEYVMTFLLAEMGTSGSLDGQQRLVVKGRFSPKNFEGILRTYINDMSNIVAAKVQIRFLRKENCLLFLRCEQIQLVCSSHQGQFCCEVWMSEYRGMNHLYSSCLHELLLSYVLQILCKF
ncbi:eukaryotic translation initiation factor 2 beta subunit [Melia azedarach]|uniref:Eukaryotic translation initiation factor 2 beta subunit n=1 Tax=Melia azedarach TaxID=155640 RepID=A0ACC1WYN3_MELAZ|nr:eukaryotic translation initiation factor 2 beta subunit [Melia azedarach]